MDSRYSPESLADGYQVCYGQQGSGFKSIYVYVIDPNGKRHEVLDSKGRLRKFGKKHMAGLAACNLVHQLRTL